MLLTPSATELTTSMTDAVLSIECILIIACLWRMAAGDLWRALLWCWVFGLLALSSLLGAMAHGLLLPNPACAVIWRVLYLSLGVLVALFLAGAVYDWRGRTVASRYVPWSIGVGAAFFGMIEFLDATFAVFVLYEVAATLVALTIYLSLAATHRLKGAGVIAASILLNLFAAGAQTSNASVHIVFPFDHNGVFHLLQMIGTAMLGLGIGIGMRSVNQNERTVAPPPFSTSEADQ
jgi:hypothetical protein